MVEANFEGLYKEYYPTIFRYVQRKLNNQELAEDITQDTFMEAYKGFDKIKDCVCVKAWLLKIAKRLLYRQYQRPENQHTLVSLSEIGDVVPTFDVYEEDDFKKNLCEVLHDDDIKLIVLLYEEGYSIAEAASRLDISLSACKMRIFRAREKIKASYAIKEAENDQGDFGAKAGKSMERPGKGNR